MGLPGAHRAPRRALTSVRCISMTDCAIIIKDKLKSVGVFFKALAEIQRDLGSICCYCKKNSFYRIFFLDRLVSISQAKIGKRAVRSPVLASCQVFSHYKDDCSLFQTWLHLWL